MPVCNYKSLEMDAFMTSCQLPCKITIWNFLWWLPQQVDHRFSVWPCTDLCIYGWHEGHKLWSYIRSLSQEARSSGREVAMKQEGWYNSNSPEWSLKPNLTKRVSHPPTYGAAPLKALTATAQPGYSADAIPETQLRTFPKGEHPNFGPSQVSVIYARWPLSSVIKSKMREVLLQANMPFSSKSQSFWMHADQELILELRARMNQYKTLGYCFSKVAHTCPHTTVYFPLPITAVIFFSMQDSQTFHHIHSSFQTRGSPHFSLAHIHLKIWGSWVLQIL